MREVIEANVREGSLKGIIQVLAGTVVTNQIKRGRRAFQKRAKHGQRQESAQGVLGRHSQHGGH